MALITLLDAQLAFGHVPLLDHADFALETQERVGLIGRNGAGKSSMLKILGGMEKPDDGSLQVQTNTRISYVAQEPGLEAVHYYDPPNFTFPFGIYLCVVDIDKGTGETKIRRFYALDDCGTRINPMIIEGQIHGGLTEGFAVAMGQLLSFDKQGNIQGNSLMDYFLPTAVETPHWETDHTVTPSPHHPIGAKGVAESPHVGSIPTFTSAMVDAFAHLGVTHFNMPHTAYRVWQQLKKSGMNT